MPARLVRTMAALSDCRVHLEATSSYGGAVESFLTQYLLVLLCAEMQQEVCAIIVERCQRPGDSNLQEFAAGSVKKVFRSVDKTDISNLAGMFGQAVRDKFNAAVDDREVTLYGNAVTNRHRVAHSGGVTVTFGDITSAVTAAQHLLVELELALG